MRITCPNCGALYDIDGVLIPPDGRDVQCSNCGTAWFQERGPRTSDAPRARAPRRAAARKLAPTVPDDAPQAPDAPEGPGLDARDPADATRGADVPAAERTQTESRADEAHRPAEGPIPDPTEVDEDSEDFEEAEDESDFAPPPPSARRPSADPATLEILRQERDRDERRRVEARRGPDLPASAPGLASSKKDPRAAAAAERERMATAAAIARARRPPASDPADDAASPASRPGRIVSPAEPRARLARRELLPDIEAINSSLRPDPKVEPGQTDVDEGRQGGGFGIGFVATILVLMVPIGLYLFADPIARAVPATAPALDEYVTWADGGRRALDRWVEALTARIAPGG